MDYLSIRVFTDPDIALSMHMLSFIYGSESVRVFLNCLFISVLSLEIQLLEKEGWGPINHWNLCLCLSQANDIRHSLLVFNGLRWEVVVPFDKIGRIVDHHCLDFILITLPQFTEDMIFCYHILCNFHLFIFCFVPIVSKFCTGS
jgi:hypothetical protein